MTSEVTKDISFTITRARIDEFLKYKSSLELSSSSISNYNRTLLKLYSWLPKDKILNQCRICLWADELSKNFEDRTVNAMMSVLNSFLRYFEQYSLLWTKFVKKEDLPKKQEAALTRGEFVQLLVTAREKKCWDTYLLMKVFGQTGIRVKDLPDLTIEALKDGILTCEYDEYQIPEPLCIELREYASECGIFEGPIFLSQAQTPIGRGRISYKMKMIAVSAGIDEVKVSPRTLRMMFCKSKQQIQAYMDALGQKIYSDLLMQEEEKMQWIHEK